MKQLNQHWGKHGAERKRKKNNWQTQDIYPVYKHMSLEENFTGEGKQSEEGTMSTLKENRHKRRVLTVP